MGNADMQGFSETNRRVFEMIGAFVMLAILAGVVGFLFKTSNF